MNIVIAGSWNDYKCHSSLCDFCLVNYPELFFKMGRAFWGAFRPFSPNLWRLIFENMNIIKRMVAPELTSENSYLHYIVGVDSFGRSRRSRDIGDLFRLLRKSYRIPISNYLTILDGERVNIVKKESITEDAFASSWKQEASRTIGDDIELLYDQMKMGKIYVANYQRSQNYFLLSKNDLEKLKSNNYDYLFRYSQRGKEFLGSSESIFVNCEGTRITWTI